MDIYSMDMYRTFIGHLTDIYRTFMYIYIGHLKDIYRTFRTFIGHL